MECSGAHRLVSSRSKLSDQTSVPDLPGAEVDGAAVDGAAVLEEPDGDVDELDRPVEAGALDDGAAVDGAAVDGAALLDGAELLDGAAVDGAELSGRDEEEAGADEPGVAGGDTVPDAGLLEDGVTDGAVGSGDVGLEPPGVLDVSPDGVRGTVALPVDPTEGRDQRPRRPALRLRAVARRERTVVSALSAAAVSSAGVTAGSAVDEWLPRWREARSDRFDGRAVDAAGPDAGGMVGGEATSASAGVVEAGVVEAGVVEEGRAEEGVAAAPVSRPVAGSAPDPGPGAAGVSVVSVDGGAVAVEAGPPAPARSPGRAPAVSACSSSASTAPGGPSSTESLSATAATNRPITPAPISQAQRRR
ncbi:MAG: hypothetical protein ACK5RL_16995 [Acidimicrobiales bacterium]